MNNLPFFYDNTEGIYKEGLNSRRIESIVANSYPSLDIKDRQEVIEVIDNVSEYLEISLIFLNIFLFKFCSN